MIINVRFSTVRAIHADRLAGPFVTAIVILCLNALVQTNVVVQPIYLACVVYSVFRGGVGSGLASSAIIVSDALIRVVAVPFGLGEPLREVKIVALACLVLVLVTGHLKRRADHASELSRANRDLTSQLSERVRSDEAAMALAAMSREINQPLEPGRIRHWIAMTTLDLLRARDAKLYWLDEASRELVCVATAGGVEDRWLGHRMPAGDEVAGRAMREQHLICVRPGAADEVHRQTLALPLRTRGKMIGALAVGVDEGHVIMETDLPLLSIFADHAALALENSHLYEQLGATREADDSHTRRIEDARLQATEEVAAGVAHHVNNRLMVILTGVQLLMPKLVAEEHRRVLEMVERAALNTAWLVDRLRHFTRGRSRVAAESADLNLAVRRAVEICRVDLTEAEARGASVDIVLQLDSIPRVDADEAALEEALAQIVRNAIEAVAAHGTVTITTSASATGVLCSVADTGVGMPGDVAQRAAEPFFTTKGPQRPGLGLSAALGIMRQMGGQLEIDSTLERGTRVAVRLRPYAA
jgi:signal transduction histidine kinase